MNFDWSQSERLKCLRCHWTMISGKKIIYNAMVLTLYYLTDRECIVCWLWLRLLSLWAELDIRSKVTGKFWTSFPHTSQFLLPFVENHLIAHSSCTSLRAPLQLHSILSVFPSSHISRQILHTASSSAISSSLFSIGAGTIWSASQRSLSYWEIHRAKSIKHGYEIFIDCL